MESTMHNGENRIQQAPAVLDMLGMIVDACTGVRMTTLY